MQFIDKISTGISSNEWIYWVIALKGDNHLIGTICYWSIVAEEDTAEIGYELLPHFYGKGIMQEAVTAVIDFGFTNMQLKTITAFPLNTNTPSIKLLQKNNFKITDPLKYSHANDRALNGNVIYILEKSYQLPKSATP